MQVGAAEKPNQGNQEPTPRSDCPAENEMYSKEVKPCPLPHSALRVLSQTSLGYLGALPLEGSPSEWRKLPTSH